MNRSIKGIDSGSIKVATFNNSFKQCKNSFTLPILKPCALAKHVVCGCLSLSCGRHLMNAHQANNYFLPEISFSLFNNWEKWLSSMIWNARHSQSLMVTPNMRGSNCRERLTNSSSKCGGISPCYLSVECFPLQNNSSSLNVFTGQLWQQSIYKMLHLIECHRFELLRQLFS
jgi:hypothetical protein